jgi:hypothetical protein
MGLAFWTLGLGIPVANFIDVRVNNLYSYFLLFWIPTVSTGNIISIMTLQRSPIHQNPELENYTRRVEF